MVHRRRKYTDQDDRILLNFIITKLKAGVESALAPRGNELWKLAVKERILPHTRQSMQGRVTRILLDNLETTTLLSKSDREFLLKRVTTKSHVRRRGAGTGETGDKSVFDLSTDSASDESDYEGNQKKGDSSSVHSEDGEDDDDDERIVVSSDDKVVGAPKRRQQPPPAKSKQSTSSKPVSSSRAMKGTSSGNRVTEFDTATSKGWLGGGAAKGSKKPRYRPLAFRRPCDQMLSAHSFPEDDDQPGPSRGNDGSRSRAPITKASGAAILRNSSKVAAKAAENAAPSTKDNPIQTARNTGSLARRATRTPSEHTNCRTASGGSANAPVSHKASDKSNGTTGSETVAKRVRKTAEDVSSEEDSGGSDGDDEDDDDGDAPKTRKRSKDSAPADGVDALDGKDLSGSTLPAAGGCSGSGVDSSAIRRIPSGMRLRSDRPAHAPCGKLHVHKSSAMAKSVSFMGSPPSGSAHSAASSPPAPNSKALQTDRPSAVAMAALGIPDMTIPSNQAAVMGTAARHLSDREMLPFLTMFSRVGNMALPYRVPFPTVVKLLQESKSIAGTRQILERMASNPSGDVRRETTQASSAVSQTF